MCQGSCFILRIPDTEALYKRKKILTLTEASVFWGKPTCNIIYKIDDNSCDCQEDELSDPKSSEVPLIFVTGFLSFCALIPPSGVPNICPLPFCFSPLEPSTWLMISLYSFCSRDTSPLRGVLSSFQTRYCKAFGMWTRSQSDGVTDREYKLSPWQEPKHVLGDS